MLSRVLIATDASEVSSRMVECAGCLDASVRATRCSSMSVVENVGGLYETLRDFYLPKLEAQRRVLESQGLSASFELPLGHPEHEINRLAEKNDAQLIVIGSRGHSRIKEMFLGSTAFKILHSARVPVLLFRLELVEQAGKEERRAVCDDVFRHVLHPTDFSKTSERAYQYLEHVVKETHCAVTLLHVHDRILLEPHVAHQMEEESRKIDSECLERRRERLLQLGAASVETLVDRDTRH